MTESTINIGTIHQNLVSVNLMVWETDPSLRNINNTIKFYSPHDLNEGDVIIGTYGDTGVSTYKIASIIESRKGNLKGQKYITATAQWRNMPQQAFAGQNLENTNRTFQIFIEG